LKFFIKKVFTNGFIRYIIMYMNENRTICSAIQAAVSLSLLLLRRLPPRLTTQDVAAGTAL
jgi:hypothetical protein